MINLEELKPILQPLLDGRDDSASVIESIQAIDKDVDVDQAKIDEINKSWNDRYLAAFFGNKKAEVLSDGSGVNIEDVGASEIQSPAEEEASDPAESISLQDIITDFTEKEASDDDEEKKGE